MSRLGMRRDKLTPCKPSPVPGTSSYTPTPVVDALIIILVISGIISAIFVLSSADGFACMEIIKEWGQAKVKEDVNG